MMVFTYKKCLSDQKNRSHFQKNEIFHVCCSILEQSHFSNQLYYYYFKRQNQAFFLSNTRNKCIISGYQKSVFLKFKLGRHSLSNKILSGYMPGFYRAV
jgi:ribosomal protein S14